MLLPTAPRCWQSISRWTLVALLLSSAAGSLSASPIDVYTYGLNFINIGLGTDPPTPITTPLGPAYAGEFTYDSIALSFTSFQIIWHGQLFDLTSAANSFAAASTGCSPSGAAGLFQRLQAGNGGCVIFWVTISGQNSFLVFGGGTLNTVGVVGCNILYPSGSDDCPRDAGTWFNETATNSIFHFENSIAGNIGATGGYSTGPLQAILISHTVQVDNAGGSGSPVPEPSGMILCASGALAFGGARWRARRRKRVNPAGSDRHQGPA